MHLYVNPRDQLFHQYDGGSGLDFITLSSDFARDAKQCKLKGGGGGITHLKKQNKTQNIFRTPIIFQKYIRL